MINSMICAREKRRGWHYTRLDPPMNAAAAADAMYGITIGMWPRSCHLWSCAHASQGTALTTVHGYRQHAAARLECAHLQFHERRGFTDNFFLQFLGHHPDCHNSPWQCLRKVSGDRRQALCKVSWVVPAELGTLLDITNSRLRSQADPVHRVPLPNITFPVNLSRGFLPRVHCSDLAVCGWRRWSRGNERVHARAVTVQATVLPRPGAHSPRP